MTNLNCSNTPIAVALQAVISDYGSRVGKSYIAFLLDAQEVIPHLIGYKIHTPVKGGAVRQEVPLWRIVI